MNGSSQTEVRRGGWRRLGGALALAAALLSGAAHGAISYVGTGTTDAANSGSTCTPGVPAVNAGDLLVAQVTVRNNRTLTAPAGWSFLREDLSNTDTSQNLYYKFANPGDSGSTLTWTLSRSDDHACVIRAYRGVDPALPIDDNNGATGGSSTTLTAPSITTSVPSAWLLTFYSAADSGADPFTTAPGMTERYDFANTDGGSGVAMAGDDELRPAAGATGTRAVTSSHSARWAAASIALRPDTTPPTIVSIARAGTNPTGAATVSWTITFSERVVNVQSADFSLVNTGLTGPAITGVTGSGAIWTVTAATGTGSGTLGLNLSSVGTIQDLAGLGLSAAVPVVGEVYTVDRAPPTIISITRAGPSPTTAANVSWTVTFSKSVTGVTGANFTLVNGGLSGSPALFSIGGSGAAWTVTATTGDGTVAGTLGLNATSATGVVDSSGNVLTGLPVTGEVYSIGTFTQDCLTDDFSSGTLDTALWTVRTISGSYTPAVVNAGGGDYRLRLTTPLNNESTFAQMRRTFPGSGNKIVLEIDYFAYGGSGADGTTVVLSDSTVSSTTGGYGGSLGYAQNTAATPSAAGFGGGWLGIGLDEYGNYPCNNEGRTGYPAGWVDPLLGAVTPCAGSGGGIRYVAVRGSGSGFTGYNLLANTGSLAAVAPASGAAGATPYRYRFTVDHSDSVHAWVKVERDTTGTGASYTTLIPTFDVKAAGSGQATVPNRWLISFTSSTGGATNYHEFKRVRVCANTISTSMTGPDHFEIRHATGTGVTCSPSTVTIVACANAACSSLYTAGTSGTLTATGTPVVNGAGTAFAIPSGSSSVTRSIQVTTPGSVVLGVTSTDAARPATCDFGTPACTFTAYDSGFIVTGSNHVAEADSSLTVQAVRKSDSSLACVPAFANTSKTINLKCAYDNPATGTLPVRVNAVALNGSGSAGAACDTTGANVSLAFDATGTATPTLHYADVGQVSVSANYTGTPGAMDSGLAMTGGGSFITRPDHFAFSQIQQAASPNLANPVPTSPYYSAGPFVKAGENFMVLATAKNVLGNTTPNYGRESSAESVQLVTSLVSPGGGNNPSINPANPPHTGSFGTTDTFGFAPFGKDCTGADAPGGACGVVNWPEVGVITLAGRVADNDYLGSGDVASTPASGTVGRFFPASFSVNASQQPGCIAGTNPYTYAGHAGSVSKKGQPANLSAIILPLSVSGSLTRNYTADTGGGARGYMKLDGSGMSIGVVVNAAGPGSAGALTGAAVNVNAGTPGRMDFAGKGSFDFANEQVPADEAFTITAKDSDNVTGTGATGTVSFRFGRLRLINANGTGRTTLGVPFLAEYFTANGYVTNADDRCTGLTTGANLLLTNDNWATSQAGDVAIGVGSGTTQAAIAYAPLNNGSAGLSFTAPNATGNVDIRTALTGVGSPYWLLFDWDRNGVYDDEANGRASFGIYGGSARHIYLREMY